MQIVLPFSALEAWEAMYRKHFIEGGLTECCSDIFLLMQNLKLLVFALVDHSLTTQHMY